ncbi:MAG: hypothetical protein DRP09_10195 [Candidatus Thorarchaeota archaeon]|nr:MAG: hypothetical protein DRP09_10195 [Candidatus Thorarchaeota archaeon]
MKTNRIMVREFHVADKVYGKTAQRTKDGYFNANLVLDAYNSFAKAKKKLSDYFRNNATSHFIEQIAADENISAKSVAKKSRGKGGGTWLHPFLFMDFAMWLSPEFKLQAIKWLYDNLIKYRRDSGSHYVRMQAAMKAHYIERYGEEPPETEKPEDNLYRREARMIREFVGLEKGVSWDNATEYQLGLRNVLEVMNIKAHEKKLLRSQRMAILRNAKEAYEIQNTNMLSDGDKNFGEF